ncbi:MAG TPA: serine/threonine-protein kinase [Allosphingosinicella sp.]|nr:serine/threonine-protein kinase [Allosphingosinicella sp.]
MSDEKDKTPPGTPETPDSGEERTVFMPGGFTLPPSQGQEAEVPAPEPEPEPPPEPEPVAETPPPPPPEPEPPAEAPAPPPPPTSTAPAFVPHKDAVGIKVGDCLNHIFQVDRFLARGGMGEVFVGCNVNTDEKVAIKVMLPALASDEKVIAMFRKEARTLTKLNHPALVQYRVLAQEPNLHVLYIVTDFIEGTNLSVALPALKPSPDELAGLLRRLASGLAAAHALGAIHRDMSPDNVILENDDIHEATIIDFGIAKDLDSSSATIVGDGFAGKLNYVAPEQLGDFGREVGPWTDVYSLGLVILAVAQGDNVDMSGSLVDAIDKRRKGPDISAIPGNLRPLVHAMLRPDPKERPRSMADVLAILEGARIPSPTTVRAEVAEEAARPETVPDHYETYETTVDGGSSKPLLIVLAVLLALAAVLAVIWYVTDGTFGLGDDRRSDVETSSGPTGSGGSQADARSPVALARSTINSAVPQVGCTWLDIGDIRAGPPVAVAMRGVAGNGEAARSEIGQALSRAGVANANVTFGDVATITPAGCTALDTYRQIRNDGARRIFASQTRYEMSRPQGQNGGQLRANAVIEINTGGTPDFALVGIEPTGVITTLIRNRGDFIQKLADPVNRIADAGNGRYRLNVEVTHMRWSGLLMVTGSGFDANLLAPPIGGRGQGWQRQFLSAASNGNWRGDMVWFQTVDQQPG